MMPTVAILAGGKARRLYPLTRQMPKAMLEVAGKPFIWHQIELLKLNGVGHIVVCCGHLGKPLKEYLGDGGPFGLKVDFSFDGDRLLGTAGAVKKALPLLGDHFAVMYGDSYLTQDFRPVADYFYKTCKKGLMTVFKNEGKWGPSNIEYRKNRILTYDKKRLTPDMKYIDYGFLFFRKEAFANVNEGQVYDLANLCADLIGEDQLAGYEVQERFYEIGSMEGLSETREYLEKRKRS